jgi:hypothetical protein
MSPAMPQTVVTRGYEMIAKDPLPDYFRRVSPISDKFCSSVPIGQHKLAFYGIPSSAYCIKYDWNLPQNQLFISYATNPLNPNFIQAGKIILSPVQKSYRSGLYFWLPQGQKVIQVQGRYPENAFAPGSQLFVYEKSKGIFSSEDGLISREVFVDLPLNESDFLMIEGILNQKIVHNL